MTEQEFNNLYTFLTPPKEPGLVKWRSGNSLFIGNITLHDSSLVYIGHPLNLKTKWIGYGRRIVWFSSFIEGIDKFYIPKKEDIELWLKYYKQFHEGVLIDKGYDSCEEDINNLRIWLEKRK